MKKVYFALVLHAHQPTGNFDKVIEQAYLDAYLPFLQKLQVYPHIRVSLHYSGGLLLWIEQNYPEYLDLLRQLIVARQVEPIGGGFYEPILPLIPQRDGLAQLERMSEFLRSRFDFQPRGIWLAERVWEPHLPSLLARGHVSYLCLDDTQFLAAGLSPDDLFGYYITEDMGRTVRIIPGSELLRYRIPFHEPSETIELLRSVSEKCPGGLVVMADDLEKFGVWPHTNELVYQHGWLDRFFQALEANQDWIEVIPAGEYLEAFPPIDRIYLPTGAYSEMMTWALPSSKQLQFEKAESLLKRPEEANLVMPFVRGGFFRNFFVRYPEANLLHKRMIHCSDRLEELRNRGLYASKEAHELWNRAYDHLLRAQGNDPYWHGIFGGLYAPHLRLSAQRNLSLAESCADEVEVSLTGRAETIVEMLDFDCDQEEEIYFSARNYSGLFDPNDGATLQFLDFKPGAIDLINTLSRRREAYHEKVAWMPERVTVREGAKTIHEILAAKDAHLDRSLVYDPYPRSCFRLMCFPVSKEFEHFSSAELDADPGLATGKYFLTLAPPTGSTNPRSGYPPPRPLSLDDLIFKSVGEKLAPRARKRFKFSSPDNEELEIACRVDVDWGRTDVSERKLGIELDFNLLASDEPDRYFLLGTRTKPLKWQGVLEDLDTVVLVDEYQKVNIEIKVAAPATWWIVPLNAVSQSEEGFELVYQGSAILPFWRFNPERETAFHTWVRVRVTRLG